MSHNIVDCPVCKGKGYLYTYRNGEKDTCTKCDGTGKICTTCETNKQISFKQNHQEFEERCEELITQCHQCYSSAGKEPTFEQVRLLIANFALDCSHDKELFAECIQYIENNSEVPVL